MTINAFSFAFLDVDRRRREPLHRQVFEGIRDAIVSGRLRAGRRLPSTRSLALELGVSRLPVLAAYQQLQHEGYLEARVGAGSFVTSVIPDDVLRAETLGRGRPASRAVRRVAPAPPKARDEGGRAPFRTSLPALDEFPKATWARIVAQHAKRLSPAHMAYGDPAGLPRLRDAVAEHLGVARALQCDPSQVIITSGSQAALRLCAAVLVRHAERVAVEDPGYPGARLALAAAGARMVPIPVDADGLDVEALDRRGTDVRCAFVTPAHQYPLGGSMSASRRYALVDWAARRGAWIVEDDYDSEFRYVSRPLGALQGMGEEAARRVIHVGTFSKVLFPSIRLGYLIVPPTLREAFVAAREALDLFSPTLYQLALATFMREGHFARHLRRMRQVYRERRDTLVEGLATHCGDAIALHNAEAGLHAATWLPRGVDDVEVVARMRARGLVATALSSCYATRRVRPGLLLGFAGFDRPTLMQATRTLGEVLRDMAR